MEHPIIAMVRGREKRLSVRRADVGRHEVLEHPLPCRLRDQAAHPEPLMVGGLTSKGVRLCSVWLAGWRSRGRGGVGKEQSLTPLGVGFGNPFHFHAESGTRMVVRSAGPDGRLFTPDDLTMVP
jgi:hypothetical protein